MKINENNFVLFGFEKFFRAVSVGDFWKKPIFFKNYQSNRGVKAEVKRSKIKNEHTRVKLD